MKNYNFHLIEKDFFYTIKKIFKDKRRYFNITSKQINFISKCKITFTFLKNLKKKDNFKFFFRKFHGNESVIYIHMVTNQ